MDNDYEVERLYYAFESLESARLYLSDAKDSPSIDAKANAALDRACKSLDEIEQLISEVCDWKTLALAALKSRGVEDWVVQKLLS